MRIADYVLSIFTGLICFAAVSVVVLLGICVAVFVWALSFAEELIDERR